MGLMCHFHDFAALQKYIAWSEFCANLKKRKKSLVPYNPILINKSYEVTNDGIYKILKIPCSKVTPNRRILYYESLQVYPCISVYIVFYYIINPFVLLKSIKTIWIFKIDLTKGSLAQMVLGDTYSKHHWNTDIRL